MTQGATVTMQFLREQLDGCEEEVRRLGSRIRAQNVELDQVLDERIERKAPGYRRLVIIRERDQLRKAMEEIAQFEHDPYDEGEYSLRLVQEIARGALSSAEVKR